MRNGRFQNERDFFPTISLNLAFIFPVIVLQGVNVVNCMYAREDEVPHVDLYFVFPCSEGLPSLIVLQFLFFLSFLSTLPHHSPAATSPGRKGAGAIPGQCRAVGSTQR